MSKPKKCCLCGKDFKCDDPIGRNNPIGAAWRNKDGDIVIPKFLLSDCCCNECNKKYVIPGRLYMFNPTMCDQLAIRKDEENDN